MVTLLAAAASGMEHYQAVIDVTGNNLANANTEAFKVSRVLAQGAPEVQDREEPARMGVSTTTVDLVFVPGSLAPTGSALDFAISDGAFFRVEDEDGAVLLTRRGALGSGYGGVVATADGFPLVPRIEVPEGYERLQVDEAGVVTAASPEGAREELGRIALVRVPNPGSLEPAGRGLYRTTENTGVLAEGFPGEDGFAPLAVGVREASNVVMAQELTTLVIALRAYQASARAFSVGDQMIASTTELG
ncbi:MAG: flagellar basal-body rod protein FlgG [Dehalococcoidia bacterium]